MLDLNNFKLFMRIALPFFINISCNWPAVVSSVRRTFSWIRILPKSIFLKLQNLKAGKDGEIHITDAIQSLIDDNENFIAHNFDGKYLDCGTINGYINSSKIIGSIWNYAW